MTVLCDKIQNRDSIPNMVEVTENGNYVGKTGVGLYHVFEYKGNFYKVGRMNDDVYKVSDFELQYIAGE